jgi:hypothetical protein
MARKMPPDLILAAAVHASTAFMAHTGMAMLRIRPPLPARSTTIHRFSRF